MGIDAKVESDSKKVIKDLKDTKKKYRQGLRRLMFRALTLLEKDIKANIRTNFNIGSGRLLNSVQKRIIEETEEIFGIVGPSNIPYARIHEFGGTIRPKKARALTIPTDWNKKADGSPIMTGSELKASGRSFIRNGMIFLQESKNRIVPMFVLASNVNIKARPYLRPALAKNTEKIEQKFGLFLDQTIGGKK